MNKGAIVIPARYQSSRFPGKPLADILGKPMIQHVYERCCMAVDKSKVYVATDSQQIKSVVESFHGQIIMTSSECLTGTDRIAEANDCLNFDFLINVQGDEPMVDPIAIALVFNHMVDDSSEILNCYSKIKDDEIHLATVPKVVISESGKLLYMSRGGCPFDKSGDAKARYKQICIYGFNRDHLSKYRDLNTKTTNEEIEDIEILRFLDLDYSVQMIEVSGGTIAVDTPDDLARVRAYLSK